MRGCAGRELLERFLGGALSAAASEAVAAHVEVCTACQALLDQLTTEPRSAALGPAGRGDDAEPEPAPEFLERLRRSLPAADPPPEVLLRWSRNGIGSQAEDESGVRGSTAQRDRPPRRCPATRSWASSAGAAWAWSTGRGRSA